MATVVRPLHFHRVVRLLGGDHQAIGNGHGDDVGKVVLALGVVVGQTAHPVGQARCGHGENAGVTFLDRLLRFAGVLVLDDSGHVTRRVTHDPTVTGRVMQRHGEQAQLLLADLRQQALQSLHLDQRYIAVQHQHGVGSNGRERLGHGMAGTELFVLHDEVQIVSGQSLTYLLGTMADDHVDTLRLQLARTVDNVAEHGVAGNRVQHLGQCGTHAGALACGENDDIEGHDWLPILGGQGRDRRGNIRKRKRVAEATL